MIQRVIVKKVQINKNQFKTQKDYENINSKDAKTGERDKKDILKMNDSGKSEEESSDSY